MNIPEVLPGVVAGVASALASVAVFLGRKSTQVDRQENRIVALEQQFLAASQVALHTDQKIETIAGQVGRIAQDVSYLRGQYDNRIPGIRKRRIK